MKPFSILAVLFLIAAPVFGQNEDRIITQTRIAKQGVTATGDRGLFTLSGVETLDKGQYSFGWAWSHTSRSPKDLSIDTFPLFFSYGLFSRLTVTGTTETEKQVAARVLSQPGFHNALPLVNEHFQKGFGDMYLAAKYRVQRRNDNLGGIALRGFVKLPSADAATGLGTGGTDVGMDLVFTSLLPKRFVLHSIMGYTATGDTQTPSHVGIKDELRSGFGAAWPSSGIAVRRVPEAMRGSLQVMFEYSSISFIGGGTANSAVQAPTDVTAGFRYLALDRGITLDAGFRVNTHFDLSFPGSRGAHRNGLTVSINYTKPVTPPPANNHFPLVALEADSTEIDVGGSAMITATGYDADSDPLTYIWSAASGQVTGSGEQVRFGVAGLAPGKYLVHVTASDGKGGVANSDIEITVRP